MTGVLVQLALLAGLFVANDSPRVEWLRDAGSTRSEGLVGRLSRPDLAMEAIRFLVDDEVVAGNFILYGSERDRIWAGPQCEVDCLFDNWLSFVGRNKLLEKPDTCPEVSEAVKLGGSIVLRTVTPDCRKSRTLLRGTTDPLFLDIKGGRHEVIWLSVRPRDYASELWGHEEAALAFYVRTDARVTPDLAKQIHGHLKTLTGVHEVIVYLRNDTWFVEDGSFPALYPFDGAVEALPSKAEFLRTPEAYCVSLYDWPVSCW